MFNTKIYSSCWQLKTINFCVKEQSNFGLYDYPVEHEPSDVNGHNQGMQLILENERISGDQHGKRLLHKEKLFMVLYW